MTDRLSAVFFGTETATTDAERALSTVYDDVILWHPSAVARDDDFDCLLAVDPDPAGEAPDALGRLQRRAPARPVLVLTTPAEETAVRAGLDGLDVTEFVVADSPDRYRRFADRLRGLVRGRRVIDGPDSSESDGSHRLDTRDDAAAADPGGYVRALYDVATDSTLDFETKADRILDIGTERLGVENAHLSTIDQGPDTYEIVASVGALPMEPGDLMDYPATFCRRTVESEDVLAINHASEQGWADDPAYENSGIECYLGSRITVGGSLFGTVCFLDRNPHESFTEAERTFVSLVARWLSHELERRRRDAALDALNETTRDLLGAGTRADVCSLLATGAQRITGGPITRVWLVDDADRTVRVMAGEGPEPPQTVVSRGDDHHLWAAIEAGEISRHTNDAATERADAVRTDGQVRSLVAVPFGDRGVIEIASETANAFDDVDVSTLSTLASSGVAALDRAEREEELAAARERFERIFASSNDALLLIDPVGDEVLECNSRACDLLDYERSDLLDAAPSALHGETADRYRSFVDEVQQTGGGWTDDLTMRRRDGHRFAVETSAAMIELPDRTCLLASVRDVTTRRRREQALQVFNRVLRHNLRNEMNVVIGQAQLLETASDEATRHEHAAEILERAEAILSLGEKARLFQQLDENTDDATALDIRAVAERVRDAVRSAHPAATVAVEGPRALAKAGPTIETALTELVENGIEHAGHDAPTVTITIEAADTDDQFAVDIADDGPGLPDGDRSVVEDGTETPLRHGSGLGLWIANWIVENNGGSMTVVRTGPDGTTIRLVLPTAPDAPSDRGEWDGRGESDTA